MQSELIERLEKAIEDRVFPGCVLGVVKASGERQVLPLGRFTYETDAPAVKEDTIYDLASVTKSILGSCALLKLIDEGRLNLEDRLVDYVPEFGNFENKKEVKIIHLLTYTLDLEIGAMAALKDRSADEILDVVVKAPLKNPPGSTYLYNNATAGFVGLIVKKIIGQTLDVYAEDNFFQPLGMERTTFFPEKFKKSEIPPTEIDAWRGGVIQGEVHDESSFVLKSRGMITAAAGLFSTVPDLLSFLQMLLNKGEYGGRRYFSEKIIEQMSTQQLDVAVNASLGWVINWPQAMGVNCSPQAFCKSGFTGTFVMVDPIKGVAFTLLSNRAFPYRPKDTLSIMQVRRDIADIIFGL